jgi:hypothetical protein
MKRFEFQWMVERIPGENNEISSVIASGGVVKDAESSDKLKAEWLRIAKSAWGDAGDTFNIEYHCTVKEVPATTPTGAVEPTLRLQ